MGNYSKRKEKGDYRWMDNTQGIYRLYHGDNIVYVGESKHLITRLKQHEREKEYWGSFDYRNTWGQRETGRKRKEKNVIRRTYPTRNIIHNR